MEAWLVQWVVAGGDGDALVAILSGCLGSEAVRRQVERMHIDMTASIQEKINYASGSRVACPAKLHKMLDGRPSIECGHNPRIEARLIADLRVKDRENGKFLLVYKDGNRRQKREVNDLPPHSCSSGWYGGCDE